MSDSFETKPFEIIHSTEEDLVRLLLDDKGIDDLDAKEALTKLVSKYEQEANLEAMAESGSAEASNRANIKCAIKVAQIYLGTKMYKDEGIDSLWDALEMASQNQSTEDLWNQIRDLISENK